MKTKIILAAVTLCVTAACKEEIRVKTYEIKGRILKNCESPAGNILVTVDQRSSALKGAIHATCVTDEQGNFKFDITKGNSRPLILMAEGKKIRTSIAAKQDHDLGDLYYASTADIKFRLKPMQAYTKNDTLYFTNFTYPFEPVLNWITGPFNVMTLSSIEDFQLINTDEHGRASMEIRYGIGKGGLELDNSVKFTLEPCQELKVVDLILE